jgi:hypothetical protein
MAGGLLEKFHRSETWRESATHINVYLPRASVLMAQDADDVFGLIMPFLKRAA